MPSADCAGCAGEAARPGAGMACGGRDGGGGGRDGRLGRELFSGGTDCGLGTRRGTEGARSCVASGTPSKVAVRLRISGWTAPGRGAPVVARGRSGAAPRGAAAAVL